MIRKPKKNSPRNTDAYNEFRKVVIKRDNGKCQMPNCKAKGSQVHHIRRYADSGDGKLNPSNGILLCKTCHTKITGYENNYTALFIKIIGENIIKNSKKNSS